MSACAPYLGTNASTSPAPSTRMHPDQRGKRPSERGAFTPRVSILLGAAPFAPFCLPVLPSVAT
eukprot:267104-Prymnesium_polylepis.4